MRLAVKADHTTATAENRPTAAANMWCIIFNYIILKFIYLGRTTNKVPYRDMILSLIFLLALHQAEVAALIDYNNAISPMKNIMMKMIGPDNYLQPMLDNPEQ